jgi:hypothetical protein
MTSTPGGTPDHAPAGTPDGTPDGPFDGPFDAPGYGARPPAADVGPLAGVVGPLPPDPVTTSLLDPTPTQAYPSHAPVAPAGPERPAPAGRTPRIRTLVFGLVMLVVAGTVLAATIADLRVDGGALVLGVLVLAGVALLAGGIAAAAKEARGGPGA